MTSRGEKAKPAAGFVSVGASYGRAANGIMAQSQRLPTGVYRFCVRRRPLSTAARILPPVGRVPIAGFTVSDRRRRLAVPETRRSPAGLGRVYSSSTFGKFCERNAAFVDATAVPLSVRMHPCVVSVRVKIARARSSE